MDSITMLIGIACSSNPPLLLILVRFAVGYNAFGETDTSLLIQSGTVFDQDLKRSSRAERKGALSGKKRSAKLFAVARLKIA